MPRRPRFTRTLGASIAVLALALACQDAGQGQGNGVDEVDVDAILDDWPETNREVANQARVKYGEPDAVTAMMLIWYDNDPWMRTIVHREGIQHDFPMPHLDIMEQTIPYQAPIDRFDDIAEYDGSVVLERTNGLMSVRCDREEANFLALNLAHDVAVGDRTPMEARTFYNDTIMALERGETPPYTQEFLFDVPSHSITRDPDSPAQ